MAKNMTEGNPMRLMLQFALPLLGGNLLQQTYNIADAAIVGRTLGADALASVGASSSVQFLVLGFCIGICCGFGIPVSRYFGAQQPEKMRRYLFNAAVLTAGIGVVVTIATALLCPEILRLLSTPDDIFADAYRYLFVIFMGIPATLLYNFLASMLRSVGDSRTPFLFLAFSTVLNIALDLFCIVTLDWGVSGAAIATVASQAASGVLCLLFIRKRVSLLHLTGEACRLERHVCKKLLLMGVPMGLQYSITAIGSMVMQAANNGLGSVYVSGFTAGMKLKQFFLCPFDALSTAVSVFCSQNLGANQAKRMWEGLKKGLLIGVAYGVLAGAILILGGRTLSLLFVDAEASAVLDASAQYVGCMGYFFWLLGILNVCRMATQGIGFAGRTVFSGVAEMAARSAVSLLLVGRYGYTVICWTDQAAWLAACLYLVPMTLLSMKTVTKEVQKRLNG
ncbi:MAG: MATE family efflux transporter [Eubacteriales bacterium]|nr:MATE family efflux transporter [Eubacteriales bacterium]